MHAEREVQVEKANLVSHSGSFDATLNGCIELAPVSMINNGFAMCLTVIIVPKLEV